MSFRFSPLHGCVLALALSALGGCGEDSGGSAGTGGASSSGGAPPSGGASQGGAAPTSGGATTLGGSSSGGVSAGGAIASGGAFVSNGGTSGASSGGVSTGGTSSGGATASGGGAGGPSGSGGAAIGGSAGANGGGAGAGKGGGAASGGSNQGGASGGAASGGSAGASGGSAGGGTTPVKLWIAGDSTVQTCSSACPCGWGGPFDALFNDKVTVQNSAVGGRSVQTWLYESAVTSTLTNGECVLSSMTYNARWTAMTNAAGGMKAGDYLFIQFGINDGDSTCPRHVGLTLFKSLFGALAQAAKDRGAHPIFLTPVSAIQCSSSTAVGTRGSYVTATKEAGTTYGVPVIDLHQLSVNLYNSLKLCPNNADYGAGAVGAFFCADHTHFEAAGAQQIAQVVAKALKDQSIPLAAYLK